MFRRFVFLFVLVSAVIAVLYYVEQPDVRGAVDRLVSLFRRKAVDRIASRHNALTRAQAMLLERLAAGDNLSAGPCLAEKIVIDWSVDIVHVPRESRDNEAHNQCRSYLRGETQHLIEMTDAGQVVSIR